MIHTAGREELKMWILKMEHSPFGLAQKYAAFFLVITSSPSNMLLFRSVLSSTSNRLIGCRKVFSVSGTWATESSHWNLRFSHQLPLILNLHTNSQLTSPTTKILRINPKTPKQWMKSSLKLLFRVSLRVWSTSKALGLRSTSPLPQLQVSAVMVSQPRHIPRWFSTKTYQNRRICPQVRLQVKIQRSPVDFADLIKRKISLPLGHFGQIQVPKNEHRSPRKMIMVPGGHDWYLKNSTIYFTNFGGRHTVKFWDTLRCAKK